MSVFSEWPHDWFGFWGDRDHPELPRLPDWVDDSWRPQDREGLVQYLQAAVVVLAAAVPPVTCSRCGAPLGNPSAYQSDGVWLWPASLGHLVDRHAVRLPDRMVAAIAAVGYRPPASIGVRWEDLPWPRLRR